MLGYRGALLDGELSNLSIKVMHQASSTILVVVHIIVHVVHIGLTSVQMCAHQYKSVHISRHQSTLGKLQHISIH